MSFPEHFLLFWLKLLYCVAESSKGTGHPPPQRCILQPAQSRFGQSFLLQGLFTQLIANTLSVQLRQAEDLIL